MSTFNTLCDDIGPDKSIQVESGQPNADNALQQTQMTQIIPADEKRKPFDIQLFADEVREHSETKNRAYAELKQSISGYDIAHNCSSNVVKKVLGYPVKSFAQNWLPVMMRSSIGNGIHDFIQDYSKQFTELEPSIKTPSIRFSGRIDGLIGNNVLVEIKSVPFSDYKKIVKNRKPRTGDFYQMMVYKYIIENHLEEAKEQPMKSEQNPHGTRTPPPALDRYNIDTLQIIYVAHDISAADVEDFGKALKDITQIKKHLNSRRNQFYFMTSVVLETKDFDETPYIDYVKRKIERINWYIQSNKIPTIDDEFVDTKKCFFCLYKPNCELI